MFLDFGFAILWFGWVGLDGLVLKTGGMKTGGWVGVGFKNDGMCLFFGCVVSCEYLGTFKKLKKVYKLTEVS